LPESTIKDDKTVIQRRTVFLTNPNVVRGEIEKNTTKNKAKEALLQKASKKRKHSGPKKPKPRKYNAMFTKIWDDSEEVTS
jgi:hypothetical protein